MERPKGRGRRSGPQRSVGGHQRVGGARLTRRELLVAGAAAVVAACAPSAQTRATRTRTPFRLDRAATLFADATVPTPLAEAATKAIAGQQGIPSAQPAPDGAGAPDLVLTFGDVPTGYSAVSVGESAATVIAHLRVPVDEVSADQALGLLSGTIGDWMDAGVGRSLPVRVVALRGLAARGVTLAADAKQAATPSALLDAIRGQEGSIAVVPVEVADWTVRNLGVGGVYPAQGRGQGTGALPPFTLRLGVSKALVDRGLDAQKLAAALAPTLAAATQTVDMVVAGDVILGRGVNNKMVAYNDYLYPYRKVRDEFMGADWRVANLECTVSDLVPIPTDPATFTFITSKKAIDGLAYAGIQAVSLANNHADNGGVPAFLDMMSSLHERGIATCGGGANLAAARQPAIQTVKGVRFALLAYNEIAPGGPYATTGGGGVAPVDVGTLPQDIAAARQRADVVIPFFHWGIEYTKDPTKHQQDVARAAIDAGADMVLGSHPHWIQGVETYKGRLIIYCLGNFIFDQDWSVPTQEGAMLHLYWRGTALVGMRLVPYRIMDRCQPNLLKLSDAADTLDRMWSGTDMLARGQYGPEPENYG